MRILCNRRVQTLRRRSAVHRYGKLPHGFPCIHIITENSTECNIETVFLVNCVANPRNQRIRVSPFGGSRIFLVRLGFEPFSNKKEALNSASLRRNRPRFLLHPRNQRIPANPLRVGWNFSFSSRFESAPFPCLRPPGLIPEGTCSPVASVQVRPSRQARPWFKSVSSVDSGGSHQSAAGTLHLSRVQVSLTTKSKGRLPKGSLPLLWSECNYRT